MTAHGLGHVPSCSAQVNVSMMCVWGGCGSELSREQALAPTPTESAAGPHFENGSTDARLSHGAVGRA